MIQKSGKVAEYDWKLTPCGEGIDLYADGVRAYTVWFHGDKCYGMGALGELIASGWRRSALIEIETSAMLHHYCIAMAEKNSSFEANMAYDRVRKLSEKDISDAELEPIAKAVGYDSWVPWGND